MTEPSVRVVRCVGAVVHDHAERLLLVRRATDPGRGRWSVPGGRVEPGENDTRAVERETREETGLTVVVGRLVGVVRRSGGPGVEYDIHDYACAVAPGSGPLRAGDDAAEARWVDAAEYARLPLVDGLTEALGGWGVLPR